MIEAIFRTLPSGVVVTEGVMLRFANPAAMHLLQLTPTDLGSELRTNGPDGLFTERLAEGLSGEPFHYRLEEKGSLRRLSVQCRKLDAQYILSQIDDDTPPEIPYEQRPDVIASHHVKKPLSVLLLGLSNLRDYYPQIPDVDKMDILNDLIDHVHEMDGAMNTLLDQLRRKT
jgi:hypothetical protein